MGFKELNDVDGNGLKDVAQPKPEDKLDLSSSDEIEEKLRQEPLKSFEESPEQERRLAQTEPTGLGDIPKSLEKDIGFDGTGKAESPPNEVVAASNKEVLGHPPSEGIPASVETPNEFENVAKREEIFAGWTEYDAKSREIGADESLSKEQKVQGIQSVYERTENKTDICSPSDAQYVSGFDDRGKIEYDWPGNLGFEPGTESAISRDNPLPDTWDRYGHMGGSNFSPIPENGPYTVEERAIPYIENKDAYHHGDFNANSYFDKVDAIKNEDIEKLNVILTSEGYQPLDTYEFDEIKLDYKENCYYLKEYLSSDIDVTYGIKGNAASWGDMCGGAEQLTMPLSGEQLERLGIMMEENSDDK